MAWLRLRPVTIVSALALVGVLQGSNATAEIRTRVIEYKQGDTILKGYLAFNDVAYGRRPGVLIGPTWTGIGALSGAGNFIKRRAEAYAALGYVAFVADIYGDGKELPAPIATATEMKKFMDNRTLLRERARAGLDILRAQAVVDPNKILVAGYCFGGAAALELARSGADIAGVVVFHGSLSNPTPKDAQNIMARVLVLQGADDPAVPPPRSPLSRRKCATPAPRSRPTGTLRGNSIGRSSSTETRCTASPTLTPASTLREAMRTTPGLTRGHGSRCRTLQGNREPLRRPCGALSRPVCRSAPRSPSRSAP